MAQNFLTHVPFSSFCSHMGGGSPESPGSELLRGSPEAGMYFRDKETCYFRPGSLSPTNSLVLIPILQMRN